MIEGHLEEVQDARPANGTRALQNARAAHGAPML
jgi:hypothetical protein